MTPLYRFGIVVYITFIIATFMACKGGSGNRPRMEDTAVPVLLFNGTGVSINDVAAIESILDNNHIGYSTVNSSALNAMNQSQIMRCRLLIIPGGNFIAMGKNLTPKTAVNIRKAVQHGLNYLGICAGGFLAGSSTYYNGFNLTSGVTFGFYAAENRGVHKAAVKIVRPGAPALDQYWEDGPQLSGWGNVVAEYPDGTPAVTEGKCGNGFVVLAGIHAEAAADWRQDMIFNTPAGADNQYAAMLIRAALLGTSLPHF